MQILSGLDFPTSCAYQTPTNTDSQPAHLLMSTSLTSDLIVSTTYAFSVQLSHLTPHPLLSRSHGGKPSFGCFKLFNQLGQHRIFSMQMSHRRKGLLIPFSQNKIKNYTFASELTKSQNRNPRSTSSFGDFTPGNVSSHRSSAISFAT